MIGRSRGSKPITSQIPDSLDVRRERESEQVGEAKDGFSVAVRVSGMDVTLDNIVLHQPVNHIDAFTPVRAALRAAGRDAAGAGVRGLR